MKVRFQADEDLNERIIAAVKRREPSVDFRTARAAGIKGLTDSQVLEVAARLGRVLVTHDLRTMPGAFGEFIQTSNSAGVILVGQHMPLAAAAEELILIWEATEAAEWVDRICPLPL